MLKKALLVTLIIALVFSFSGAALADDTDNIGEKVEEYTQDGGEVIKAEINVMVDNLVTFVRGIAGILGVVFVIWAGFVFFGAGGDPRKMAFAKSMMAGFIVCIIFVFAAEKIVGGLLGLLGYGG